MYSEIMEKIREYDGKKLVVFDVETTGFNAKADHIIQLSAKKYSISKTDGLTFEDEFDTYVKPPIPIPEEITKLTGISDETVKDAITIEYVACAFLHFIKDADGSCLLAAYNNAFDEKFLFKAGLENDVAITASTTKQLLFPSKFKEYHFDSIDVLALIREAIPKTDIGSHKLESVAEYLGLMPEDANFHSADFDVEMTAQILDYMIKSGGPKARDMIVESFSFWSGPTEDLKRIYVNGTNGESVYYDKAKDCWVMKDRSRFVYDPDDLDRQCADLINGTVAQFHAYTGGKVSKE